MKIMKWLIAAFLGLSVQGVFADQIRGTLFFVGALPNGIPYSTTYTAFASMNPELENFTDWDISEENDGYAANCVVPYVGWPLYISLSTPEDKQAMALLASANATGQEVFIFYHTIPNVGAATPSGLDCILDGVSVVAAGQTTM